MTESLPATAVLRISRGTFDPARFDEISAADEKTRAYLIPAIQRLPGLLHWYTGVSPDGSMVMASVWDTDEHAAQMSSLKEMVVDARGEMEALGVVFIPIVNYPITWTI